MGCAVQSMYNGSVDQRNFMSGLVKVQFDASMICIKWIVDMMQVLLLVLS